MNWSKFVQDLIFGIKVAETTIDQNKHINRMLVLRLKTFKNSNLYSKIQLQIYF
jgi:hypothetical protein